MRLVKQQNTLSVSHIDVEKNHVSFKHGPLLPDSIRCLVCGPSNCGKTNLMLNLIYDKNGLKFENIYIFSKSLHQPKYIQLSEILSSVNDVGYFAYGDNKEIPPPEQALPNSIFIFDDIACAKQDVVRSYFCMGRHNGVDSFYLCQSYTRIPKHLIRDNANLLIIFNQDELNLRRIYDDHVNSDMGLKQFKEICKTCWNSKYGFLVIDKDRELNDGRYRKGFDVYITE